MDFLYVGTWPPAGPGDMAALLQPPQCAIWCPPPNLRAWNVTQPPATGDRLWLLHQKGMLLLGGGRIVQPAEPRYANAVALWTNSNEPQLALVTKAQELGYPGGVSMTFLRVSQPQFPAVLRPAPFASAPTGLSSATPAQAKALDEALPISGS